MSGNSVGGDHAVPATDIKSSEPPSHISNNDPLCNASSSDESPSSKSSNESSSDESPPDKFSNESSSDESSPDKSPNESSLDEAHAERVSKLLQIIRTKTGGDLSGLFQHLRTGEGVSSFVEGLSDITESPSNEPLSKALLLASARGDLGNVKHLVEVCNVDPHSCRDADVDDVSPLHCASRYGHLDIVKYLVEKRNFDIMCRNKVNNTAAHDAAQGGTLNIVQYMISERGYDPLCKGHDGRNVLHFACKTDRLDVVKYLVEDVKVDTTCRDDDTKATPLHVAAIFGATSVVQYMIEEQQCNIECGDKDGNTPLYYAAAGGTLDTVRYLIDERGCDPMGVCEKGKTPLHLACQAGSVDMVKYLIDEKKVDSSRRDILDMTPLHTAALNGQLSVVKLLVEDYLFDPGVGHKYGFTLSDVAGLENQTNIISYLSSIENIVCSDLRRTLVSQLKPYTRMARPTGTVLGSGTFGSVIELTSATETVAGKIFKISSTVRLQAIASKVCGELIMMTRLHHPNIVQCKGVSLPMDQPLPVLLMERMMSNLHTYLLDVANSNLSVERKVSILRDTANGLAYLHSQTPAIIHRDLTTTNVLLDSKLRAKIADFGNSRIMDLDSEATPETFTNLPGAPEYMPPEAQGGSGKYDPSLDVFSFGHLALLTVTQKQAQLLPPTYLDSAGRIRPRSEVKRREKFFEAAEQLLSRNHSLVVVIKECLNNTPAQRPRAVELLKKLEVVTPGYQVFGQLSGSLLIAIQDPMALAWELHAKGLINREVREQACLDARTVQQRVSCLLTALEGKIASDETAFDTFLSALSQDPVMEDMCQQLKDARGTCSHSQGSGPVGSETAADSSHTDSFTEGDTDSETDSSHTEKSASSSATAEDTKLRVTRQSLFPDPPAAKRLKCAFSLDCDDLFDVRSELIPVAARWKDIGLALRLDFHGLNKIATDNVKSNDRNCLTEVLHLWLTKKYNIDKFGEPSWPLLVRAVSHPEGGNDRALAEEIAEKYKVPTDTIHH